MNSKTPEIDALISEYVRAAISYGEALKDGHHVKANAEHGVITKTFQQLVELGSTEALLSLLEVTNPAVQCWAAVHALDIAPIRGESTLEAVANGPPSPIRMMAQIKLTEWRKAR